VVVALVVVLLAPGLWAWAAAPAAVVAWRRAGRLETAAVRRRRERLVADLPHVVDLVRALVATGAAPDRALRAVCGVVAADTAAELRPWVGRLALGGDPVAVWAELARHPQLGRLGTSLHRAAVGGVPVTDALQRLADDLRTAMRADVHRRVRQVEVRATAPLGACLLPAFLLLGVVPLVAGAARTLVWG
jgi:Flp pilus assembly protein TadB